MQVAVAIIVRNDQVLISKRALHKHEGGKWEFPGGKVELGEPVEAALARECQEELAINIQTSRFVCSVLHHYPERDVQLEVFEITHFEGEPEGCEGQAIQWVAKNDLLSVDFPNANQDVLAKYLGQ